MRLAVVVLKPRAARGAVADAKRGTLPSIGAARRKPKVAKRFIVMDRGLLLLQLVALGEVNVAIMLGG